MSCGTSILPASATPPLSVTPARSLPKSSCWQATFWSISFRHGPGLMPHIHQNVARIFRPKNPKIALPTPALSQRYMARDRDLADRASIVRGSRPRTLPRLRLFHQYAASRRGERASLRPVTSAPIRSASSRLSIISAHDYRTMY